MPLSTLTKLRTHQILDLPEGLINIFQDANNIFDIYFADNTSGIDHTDSTILGTVSYYLQNDSDDLLTIVFRAGTYLFDNSFIIPDNTNLIFLPGSQLILGTSVSLTINANIYIIDSFVDLPTFNVPTGTTLQISKEITAPNKKIFTGSGTYSFINDCKLTYFKWFSSSSILNSLTDNITCIIRDIVSISSITTFTSNINFIIESGADFQINANTTINGDVTVNSNGKITIGTSNTLTLNGGFYAQPDQIIYGSQTIIFNKSKVKEAYPQWFGAIGNGVLNCTTAFIKCLSSHSNIFVPEGVYIVSPSNISINEKIIKGEFSTSTSKGTWIKATSGTGNIFSVVGTSTNIITNTIVESINFYGTETIDGISIGYTEKIYIKNCAFSNLRYGIDFPTGTDISNSELNILNNNFLNCTNGLNGPTTKIDHSVIIQNSFSDCTSNAIYLANVEYSIINENIISSQISPVIANNGIKILTSRILNINENSISGIGSYGMFFSGLQLSNILNNNLNAFGSYNHESGIYFQSSNGDDIANNDSSNNNVGNNSLIGYSDTDGVAHAIGIEMVAGAGYNIYKNKLHVLTTPIYCHPTTSNLIYDNIISDNFIVSFNNNGIYLINVANCSMNNNYIDGYLDTVNPTTGHAIFLDTTIGCCIIQNRTNNVRDYNIIYCSHSDRTIISTNYVTGTATNAIAITYSSNCIIAWNMVPSLNVFVDDTHGELNNHIDTNVM